MRTGVWISIFCFIDLFTAVTAEIWVNKLSAKLLVKLEIRVLVPVGLNLLDQLLLHMLPMPMLLVVLAQLMT